MCNKRNEILKDLITKGIITQDISKDLSLSFVDFMKSESNKEIELLEEVERVIEKKNKGVALSFSEERFYKYFIAKYSY